MVKVDRRIRWHYTRPTTILRLRIGARLTRYRNCKFHNFARTISRYADGISRYSVPPSAGPLLPLIRHMFKIVRFPWRLAFWVRLGLGSGVGDGDFRGRGCPGDKCPTIDIHGPRICRASSTTCIIQCLMFYSSVVIDWCQNKAEPSLRRSLKGSPYSNTERRVPELIPLLDSQPAGDVSHKPAVGCHYFPPGLQLPPQPLILLLGE